MQILQGKCIDRCVRIPSLCDPFLSYLCFTLSPALYLYLPRSLPPFHLSLSLFALFLTSIPPHLSLSPFPYLSPNAFCRSVRLSLSFSSILLIFLSLSFIYFFYPCFSFKLRADSQHQTANCFPAIIFLSEFFLWSWVCSSLCRFKNIHSHVLVADWLAHLTSWLVGCFGRRLWLVGSLRLWGGSLRQLLINRMFIFRLWFFLPCLYLFRLSFLIIRE